MIHLLTNIENCHLEFLNNYPKAMGESPKRRHLEHNFSDKYPMIYLAFMGRKPKTKTPGT